MELNDALNQRRTIRSYTGEPPTDAQLDAIVQAASEAPVGMGRYDSIHLTIVRDPQLISDIDVAAATAFGHPELHALYGAPVLIVVSSSRTGNVASANVGAAIQNMSLEAVEQGLGSCFIYGALETVNARPDLLGRLRLPEGFTPLGSIIVGKTNEAYAPRKLSDKHRFAQTVIA